MKTVQTFWSGSSAKDNPWAIAAGWLSPEYHWMSWTLSCLQTTKFHKQVDLITDDLGKEILVDVLKLPYTNVSASLEGKMNNYPPELWSLAKIYSYSIQQEPFIHLDGDVFLWQPIDEEMLRAGIAAQNLEVDLPYYRKSLTELKDHFSTVPAVLKELNEKDTEIYASNTGIFGGHDLRFITYYCDTAYAFIDENRGVLDKVNKANLNFIFEQCLLYYLAAEQKQPISYFMKEAVREPAYTDYARFIDIPAVKMIHTVGGYKKMSFTCDHLAKRLRKEYPDYYYKVINTCKQNNVLLKNTAYFFIDLNKEENKVEPEQADGFYKEDEPKAFCRTLAALNYLEVSKAYPGINLNAFAFAQDTIVKEMETIADDRKKEIVNEISTLETKTAELLQNVNDKLRIHALYKKDLINYVQTEELFLRNEDEILDTIVSVDDAVVLLELQLNWHYNSSHPSLQKFVASKFNEEAALRQVALVADPLKLSVNEIYLDPIDMLIVSICDGKISISDALEEIKQYFDPEELEDNPEAYTNLVLDAIKRLMFSNILCSKQRPDFS